MWRFIFKRLLHMIPLLIGVSLLTFLLMSLAPGDYFTALQQNPQISPETIAKLKAQFHLDKPWYVQYFYWLKNILHGDFGYSMAYKIPATSLIFRAAVEYISAFVFRDDFCVGRRHPAGHLGGGEKRFVG
jgi:peptide/nickel transport system permease protein